MKKTILSIIFIGTVIIGCKKEDINPSSNSGGTGSEITISISDLSGLSIDENSPNGTVISSILATVENSNDQPVFTILNQNPNGAIQINGNDIIIADVSKFDYETNTQITGNIMATIGTVQDTANFTIAINDVNENATPTKDNTLRQITGTAQDFEISHMYAQKWDNVYLASGNPEGALKFDIREPLNGKRLLIYFSGISATNKTYTSSAGSSPANVKLSPGEFVVEKISLGSQKNYWWKPNAEHKAQLTISGGDVTVEIKDFEIGGGLGSIGTETFNIKFTFALSDYNALSDNSLKLIHFK
ncbi:cadherin repeat domain-containing protein [bacterium SCSIO 12643]|nr:cadherin repeat domain-containing protein [bacterium SCSIO 12643]